MSCEAMAEIVLESAKIKKNRGVSGGGLKNKLKIIALVYMIYRKWYYICRNKNLKKHD
jgi:hypothetical protein